jgi:hypothetical protein
LGLGVQMPHCTLSGYATAFISFFFIQYFSFVEGFISDFI